MNSLDKEPLRSTKILPARRWLPVVLELRLARLKTPAAQTSAEIIDFLLGNPTADEVMGYHASDRSQERLHRLFALNSAGLLGEAEQAELTELEQLEHIISMLKTSILKTRTDADGC